MDSEYLFVYGSLLKQANNIMSTYLSEKSELVGEAYMHGRLFMVDYYPGAIHEADAESLVKGALYKLHKRESTFRVLDRYEEFTPEDIENSVFIRKIIPVEKDGKVLHCWVYIYNQDINGCQPIASGDFLRFDMNQH